MINGILDQPPQLAIKQFRHDQFASPLALLHFTMWATLGATLQKGFRWLGTHRLDCEINLA